MKLTILGTGNAAVCECYNTCFALTNEAGETFLTDCGGGNRILKVLKDAGIPLTRIFNISWGLWNIVLSALKQKCLIYRIIRGMQQ